MTQIELDALMEPMLHCYTYRVICKYKQTHHLPCWLSFERRQLQSDSILSVTHHDH